jgi:hypothetical protein
MMLAACAVLGVACGVDKGSRSDPGGAAEEVAAAVEPVIVTSGATTTSTPIGLALQIEGGVGQPLKVRAGQTFFVNQIDMRASLDVGVDEGVSGLAASGDFSTVNWNGVEMADQSAEDTPGPDGTYTNRRFYRHAAWMDKKSSFTVLQVDGSGHPTATPTVVSAGADDKQRDADGFFVRRMRAIQWTFGCSSRSNCAGSHAFQEEALVELRDSLHPEATFKIEPTTAALRVVWSQNPTKTYAIPVQQVASPALDYGFTIDLFPVTAPQANGTYPIGSDITFRLQLRDGAGNPLHPADSLPSFSSVSFGGDTSGIQYWRGFFEPFATYYRRKHLERHLMNQLIGPAQKVGPVRSVLDLTTDIGPDDTVHAASPERDGLLGLAHELPSFGVMFGGTVYPPLWDLPVPTTFTYHIPANAEPGTYLVTQKGRRVYLGQDIPAAKTIEIQVGTVQHSEVVLSTGGCVSCHNANSAFSLVNHGNSNRGACTACHAPLTFELEGPVYVRTHFLHSRSNRFDDKVQRCANCHLNVEGIQRTSKSACLSCHKSYPKSHVDQYGAIDQMYVGTEASAFEQCSTTCHTNHPGSGLGGCDGNN